MPDKHALIGRTRCRCRRGLDKTQASFAFAAATEEESEAPRALDRPLTRGRASIPRLVHQAVLRDPRHHPAKFFADLFDLVLGGTAAQCLEARLPGRVLEHPF